ncbi:hypothetical protein P7C70_g7271, partial [Phenoliferia sp. Uapishka_3]
MAPMECSCESLTIDFVQHEWGEPRNMNESFEAIASSSSDTLTELHLHLNDTYTLEDLSKVFSGRTTTFPNLAVLVISDATVMPDSDPDCQPLSSTFPSLIVLRIAVSHLWPYKDQEEGFYPSISNAFRLEPTPSPHSTTRQDAGRQKAEDPPTSNIEILSLDTVRYLINCCSDLLEMIRLPFLSSLLQLELPRLKGWLEPQFKRDPEMDDEYERDWQELSKECSSRSIEVTGEYGEVVYVQFLDLMLRE